MSIYVTKPGIVEQPNPYEVTCPSCECEFHCWDEDLFAKKFIECPTCGKIINVHTGIILHDNTVDYEETIQPRSNIDLNKVLKDVKLPKPRQILFENTEFNSQVKSFIKKPTTKEVKW